MWFGPDCFDFVHRLADLFRLLFEGELRQSVDLFVPGRVSAPPPASDVYLLSDRERVVHPNTEVAWAEDQKCDRRF